MSFYFSPFLWFLLPLFFHWFKIKKNQGLKRNLQCLSLILLIVALARPVEKEGISEEKIMAQSLVIALDLSVSMNAKDVEPSRYEASYMTIEKLLLSNKKDQIALLGFTSNTLMLSPPTTDHKLVLTALEALNREYILTKGTSLRRVFEKVSHFKDREKNLILFSDGGDEMIDENLISLLHKYKIKVVVVALGTEEGATIALEKGTVLLSKKGNIVVSKRNEGLENLAEESGGVFILHHAVEDTLKSIEEWLEDQKTLKSLDRQRENYKELALYPICLALLFLFLSGTHLSRVIVFLFAFVGIEISAGDILTQENWGKSSHESFILSKKGFSFLDNYYLSQAYYKYNAKEYNASLVYIFKITKPSLEEKVILAYNYYKLKEYKQAKNVLERIETTNREIKQEILYALGNCEAHLAYYEKAKKYYIKALQLGEDEDVFYNLEQVIFKLSMHKSKLGAYNPSAPKRSKNSPKSEEESQKVASKKGKKESGAGGASKKVSKNATFKIKKQNKSTKSKSKLSSKAYDLINKGFIREDNPW